MSYGYRHTLDVPPGCLCTVTRDDVGEWRTPPPTGCPPHGILDPRGDDSPAIPADWWAVAPYDPPTEVN